MFLSHVRYICPRQCKGIPGAGGALRVQQDPHFPKEAPPPPGTPTLLFNEVCPGVCGRGLAHLQGLGERQRLWAHTGAPSQWPHFLSGGDPLPARRGRGLSFLCKNTPWPVHRRHLHKWPWPAGPNLAPSRPSGGRSSHQVAPSRHHLIHSHPSLPTPSCFPSSRAGAEPWRALPAPWLHPSSAPAQLAVWWPHHHRAQTPHHMPRSAEWGAELDARPQGA